ncbi:MAG: PAS domain S-box protein [Desulfobacteraceae bacterium]|nr:PAS domain S-box protein [Desulfobacteraceae bacterium]
MKIPFWAAWSIRIKFFLVIFTIFLPACGIMIASSLERRDREIAKARENALLLVQSLAVQQDQFVMSARLMLSALAQAPAVQRLDSEACNRHFREICERHPVFSVIALVTPDGNLLASSVPFTGTLDMSDRKHVREVIQTRDFSAGEFILGRTLRFQSINYASPVMDSANNLIGIVVAGFRLDAFRQFVSNVRLTEGFALTITDHAGVLLFRYPAEEVYVPGTPIPADVFAIMSSDTSMGISEMKDASGAEQLYAYKQSRLRSDSKPYLYMCVGMPSQGIIDQANFQLLRNLIFLALAALMSMALAWVVGYLGFLRPIACLALTAQGFGRGERGIRTGLPHTPDEIGQLAHSFDEMASLVEEHEAEHHEVLQALLESEEKYRNLVEATGAGYAVVDKQGSIKDANAEYARLSGHRAVEEVLGRNIAEWSAPLPVQEGEATAQVCGLSRKQEVEYRGADGQVTAVEIHASPIQTEGGEIILLLCRDITERRRTEEALQRSYDEMEIKVAERTAELSEANEQLRSEIAERSKVELALRDSERQFRELADFLPQSVFEVDLDYYFTFLNRAAYAALGYTPEDFEKGLKWLDVVAPEDCKKLRSYLPRIIGGEIIEYFEVTAMKKDGTRFPAAVYPSAKLSPEMAVGIRGIAVNLTEQKKVEGEYLQAQKLESLEILAGGVAHDFNNLLGIILGNANLLEDSVQSGGNGDRRSARIQNHADQIQKACLQAANLTREFLILSKSGVPQKAVQQVGDILEDVVNLALSGSNVQARFHMERGLWETEYDPLQIRRVVMNVVSNAREAMPKGGTIDVYASNVELAAPVDNLAQGRYVRISFEDHGMGISPEHLPKIFDPYFSTKQRGVQKGMGLGLTVAYSIVKRHGGHIGLESRKGSGAIFHVYLPAYESKPEEDRRPAKERSPVGPRPNVLVMDDDEMFRTTLGKMLAYFSCDVSFAAEGSEAVELFVKSRSEGRPFDVLLLDLTIKGGMGGEETLQAILAIDPTARAIVSSGYSDDPVISHFKDFGFMDALVKPYSIAQLGRALRAVCGLPDGIASENRVPGLMAQSDP